MASCLRSSPLPCSSFMVSWISLRTLYPANFMPFCTCKCCLLSCNIKKSGMRMNETQRRSENGELHGKCTIGACISGWWIAMWIYLRIGGLVTGWDMIRLSTYPVVLVPAYAKQCVSGCRLVPQYTRVNPYDESKKRIVKKRFVNTYVVLYFFHDVA